MRPAAIHQINVSANQIMHPYCQELVKVLGLSRKAGYFRLNIWLLYEGSISAGLLMLYPLVFRPSTAQVVEWVDQISYRQSPQFAPGEIS